MISHILVFILGALIGGVLVLLSQIRESGRQLRVLDSLIEDGKRREEELKKLQKDMDEFKRIWVDASQI